MKVPLIYEEEKPILSNGKDIFTASFNTNLFVWKNGISHHSYNVPYFTPLYSSSLLPYLPNVQNYQSPMHPVNSTVLSPYSLGDLVPTYIHSMPNMTLTSKNGDSRMPAIILEGLSTLESHGKYVESKVLEEKPMDLC